VKSVTKRTRAVLLKTKAALLKTKAAPTETTKAVPTGTSKAAAKRRARVLLVAALSLFALALASARGAAQSSQSAWMNLPPLPVGEKNFPARLAPVVGAEHAFAQYSIDHGMKDAFLSFAAPDGVVFRRGPVNAIELWKGRNPAPTGLLTWWPSYADVSGAGDLGWTTGPYQFREKSSDAKPAGTGHFFTVWRRQPDGAWKFVLDLGIEHPAPTAPETALQYPASLRKSARASSNAGDADAARRTLLEAERSLAEDSASKGMTTALLSRADETLRLYRQNSFPVVGREAVRATLKDMTEFVRWETLKADVADSGDLGYAYGTYAVTPEGSEKPSEQGNYARVWKRQRGGPWRVVFNVATPVR
jgi:ketosteroid isomerase-like protein